MTFNKSGTVISVVISFQALLPSTMQQKALCLLHLTGLSKQIQAVLITEDVILL